MTRAAPPLLVSPAPRRRARPACRSSSPEPFAPRASPPRSSRPTPARCSGPGHRDGQGPARRAGASPAPRPRPRGSGRAVLGRRLRAARPRGADGIAAARGLAILGAGPGLYLRAVARAGHGRPSRRTPLCGPGSRWPWRATASDRRGAAAELAPDPGLADRPRQSPPRRAGLEIAELRGDAPPPPPLGYAGPVTGSACGSPPTSIANGSPDARGSSSTPASIEEAQTLRERFDPSCRPSRRSATARPGRCSTGSSPRAGDRARHAPQRRSSRSARRRGSLRARASSGWTQPDALRAGAGGRSGAPRPRVSRSKAEVEVGGPGARVRRDAARPRAPAAIMLDPARVHAWRLDRQLLARAKAASPVEVAERLIGVQAQVTSSAALSIALRSSQRAARPPPSRRRRAPCSTGGSCGRGRCAGPSTSSPPTTSRRSRPPSRPRDVAPARVAPLVRGHREGDGAAHRHDRRGPRRRPAPDARRARRGDRRPPGREDRQAPARQLGRPLKVASDRHYLVQSAEDDAGVGSCARRGGSRPGDRGSARGAGHARRAVPRGLRPGDAEGGAALVGRRDRRDGQAGHRGARRPPDRGRGGRRSGYVRTKDVEAIQATRPRKGTVVLVGGFDPLIVGAGLREQLLPAPHLKRVSRTAGWISPVVLIDGVAAGVWDSARSGGRLAITVDLFERASPKVRASIATAAERVAAAQGLTAAVAYGRVFEGKGPSLTIGPDEA